MLTSEWESMVGQLRPSSLGCEMGKRMGSVLARIADFTSAGLVPYTFTSSSCHYELSGLSYRGPWTRLNCYSLSHLLRLSCLRPTSLISSPELAH